MNSDEFTEAKRLAMEYYARSLADLQKGYNHSQILEALCFSTVVLLRNIELEDCQLVVTRINELWDLTEKIFDESNTGDDLGVFIISGEGEA
jgi:hypothetical protein